MKWNLQKLYLLEFKKEKKGNILNAYDNRRVLIY